MIRKSKTIRRLKRGVIHTIALCKRGANRLPGIYKSDKVKDGLSFETVVIKNDNLLGDGLLTSVIYAPELMDSQNELASADVIKDLAHGFFREGGNINIDHDGNPVSVEEAYPAESFVIQKGDPRFANVTDTAGNPVDVTGGWGMVIKIEDPELRKMYASGDWNGVSMEGVGDYEIVQKEATFGDALASRLGKNSESEILNMDSKELGEIVAKSVVEGVTLAMNKRDEESKNTNPEPEVDPIAKTLFPSDEPKQKIAHAAIQLAKANGKSGQDLMVEAIAATSEEVEKKDQNEAPEFKGDPSNLEDVKKHKAALDAYNARKDVDFTDPKAVQKYIDSLAKSDDGEDLDRLEELAGIEKSDSDEVKRLKLELFKAENTSNQENGDDTNDEFSGLGLSKSEQTNFARGKRMADFINKRRNPSKESATA